MEDATLHILDEGLSPQQLAVAAACCKAGPKAITTTADDK